MSSRTMIVTPWLPLTPTATVADLPVPTLVTDGGALTPEWRREGSSVAIRLSKAAAAMSLASLYVCLYVVEGGVGAWYRASGPLNAGAAVVLDSVGYLVEVPCFIQSATRIALAGTPTGTGAFSASAALVDTNYG